MIHSIEQKLNTFLQSNAKEYLKSHEEEFISRLKASLKDRIEQKDEREFKIRMSNIGLSLRQLCLQRDYGRSKSTPEWWLNSFYGVILESLVLFLLKSSGVNVEAQNKKVSLKVGEYNLEGELDLIIDGAVWDVKSASPYSYDRKFESYKSLEEDDSFGYMGQLFGYSMAAGVPAGGWIVINKARGLIKCVTIPASVQKMYQMKYKEEFATKIAHILNGNPAPECSGVVPETFRKKLTGNKILDRNCEYCNYKEICNPGVICMDSLVSEAKDKPKKYYIKIDKKYNV